MKRDYAWRKHQRLRKIQHRLRIIKEIWWYDPSMERREIVQPGRLSKWNLVCSCPMCREARKTRRPETGGPDE